MSTSLITRAGYFLRKMAAALNHYQQFDIKYETYGGMANGPKEFICDSGVWNPAKNILDEYRDWK